MNCPKRISLTARFVGFAILTKFLSDLTWNYTTSASFFKLNNSFISVKSTLGNENTHTQKMVAQHISVNLFSCAWFMKYTVIPPSAKLQFFELELNVIATNTYHICFIHRYRRRFAYLLHMSDYVISCTHNQDVCIFIAYICRCNFIYSINEISVIPPFAILQFFGLKLNVISTNTLYMPF